MTQTLPDSVSELTEKQKKELTKVMEQAQEKQTKFLESYRDLKKKYGFDFIAVPILLNKNGKELPQDKIAKIAKSINRILFQEHADLKATFQLVPCNTHDA